MTDTRFYYASDYDKFRKFKLDLELLMKHKSQHCAPALENYWAQEIAEGIVKHFSVYGQKQICDLLFTVLKGVM